MSIEINTAADFIALANLSDDAIGTADAPLEIVINDDLDFSDVDDFGGTAAIYANIYGNGHVIKNIAWSKLQTFNFITLNGGSVSQLTFDNCSITVTGASLYLFKFTVASGYEFSMSEIIVKNNCMFISTTSDCAFFYTSGTLGGCVFNFSKILVSGIWNARYLYMLHCRTSGTSSKTTVYRLRHIGINITGTGLSSNPYCRTVYSGSNYTTTYITYMYNISTLADFIGTGNAGLCAFSGSGGGNLSYCYASIELLSETNWKQIIYKSGNGTISAYCVLANSDKLGDTSYATATATTEELKSAEWLRSQGWVI